MRKVAITMTKLNQTNNNEPSVVGFVCNWGAYSGVEMAGVNNIEYPASIKLVKVMCLGRLHVGNVLKAFELGADGVLLLSCPPAECHYKSGSEQAKKMVTQAKKVLYLLGTDPRRLSLVEVPLGRDDTLVRRVSAFVNYLKKAGVSPLSSERLPVEFVEEGISCQELAR